MSNQLEFKGKFENVHPARLLCALFNAEKTGLLISTHNDKSMALPFGKGMPVFDSLAYSDQEEVARTLIDYGMLSAKQLAVKLNWARTRHISLRQTLIDDGLVNVRDWDRAAQESFGRNLEEVFGLTRGTYVFRDMEIQGGTDRRQFPTLIYNGLAHYSTSFMQRRMAPRWSKPLRLSRRSSFALEDLPLNAALQPVAEMMRLGQSPQQIVDKSKAPFSDTLRLLYAALTLGIVKFKLSEQDRAAKQRRGKRPKIRSGYEYISPALERALNEAETSVERIREQAELSSQLGAVEYEPPPGPRRSRLTPQAEDFEEPLFAAEMEEDEPPAPPPDAEPAPRYEEPEPVQPEPEPAPEPEPPPERDVAEPQAAKEENPFSFLDNSDESLAEEPPAQSMEQTPEDLTFTVEDNAEDIYAIGMSYIDQESYAYARIALQEAINRGYTDIEAYAQLGWAIYRDVGGTAGFEQATAMIQEGLANKTSHFLPYLVLGRIYKSEGDMAMAELYYVKAIELNRDCSEAKDAIKSLFSK